jgi:archaellum component FlaC
MAPDPENEIRQEIEKLKKRQADLETRVKEVATQNELLRSALSAVVRIIRKSVE